MSAGGVAPPIRVASSCRYLYSVASCIRVVRAFVVSTTSHNFFVALEFEVSNDHSDRLSAKGKLAARVPMSAEKVSSTLRVVVLGLGPVLLEVAVLRGNTVSTACTASSGITSSRRNDRGPLSLGPWVWEVL